MSRWAEAFAALSGGADTLDTMRHSDDQPAKVSRNVNSVTAARAKPPIRATDCTAANWGEVETQRAAIGERVGNTPRDWAAGFARLDPEGPPADVPSQRWLAFIDDCRRFLDGNFAAKAAALGWGAFDVFGCHRERPFARIDQAGMLWLLNGDRLIALSENTATIETRSGARQTWRRKPSEPGRVLAWELAP